LCRQLHTVDDDGHRAFGLAHRSLAADIHEKLAGMVRFLEGYVRRQGKEVLGTRDACPGDGLFVEHLDRDRNVDKCLIAFQPGYDDLSFFCRYLCCFR